MRRSAQRFFIISDMRLRASGDILRRRRFGAAGASAVSSGDPPAGTARAPLAATWVEAAGLRGQSGQALPRLEDLPFDAAERPADEFGGLDQDIGRILARSSSRHLSSMSHGPTP